MSRPKLLFFAIGLLFLVNQVVRSPIRWQQRLTSTWLWMHGLRTKPIFAKNSFIHLQEGGHGPTLILLHEFGGSSASWAQTIIELQTYFRVVVPDLRGHGEYSLRGTSVSMSDLLDDVERIGQEYDDESVILVGHSLGAWLAMNYALQHRDKVRNVALVNPMGFEDKAQWDFMLPKSKQEMLRNVQIMTGKSDMWLPGFMLRDLLRLRSKSHFDGLFQDLMSYPRLDRSVPSYKKKVDFIWGTPDRVLPFDKHAKKTASLFPAAVVHQLTRCGHAPQIACPEQLTSLLIELYATSHQPAD